MRQRRRRVSGPASAGPRGVAPLALASALAAWLLAPDVALAASTITIRTQDNVPLAATLYEPSSGPGPVVVLVHMHLRTRRDWDAVGERLASNGIAALALDLRGHGDSGVGRFDTTTFTGAVADVRAAVLYLKVRRDLVNGGIGIAGASVGANLAVLEAAGDPVVRSLALLSPGMDYRGLRIEAAVRSFGARPALVVASAEDYYAMRSARLIAGLGPGTREIQQVEGAGHGTVMLERRPDLVEALVDWFRRTLL